MVREVTATEAKAKLLSILDEVERGEEIQITRRGRIVARLSPARGPHSLLGRFRGIATSDASDEELYSARLEWNLP